MGEFITYDNGIIYKTLNRRVIIMKQAGFNLILFIRTTTPQERKKILPQENISYYCRNKIKVTVIELKNEGLEGLMTALNFYIKEGYLQ